MADKALKGAGTMTGPLKPGKSAGNDRNKSKGMTNSNPTTKDKTSALEKVPEEKERSKAQRKKDAAQQEDFAKKMDRLFSQTGENDEPIMKKVEKPKLKFKNSYRLEPNVRLNPDRTKIMMQAVMESMLERVVYRPEKAKEVVKGVSEALRRETLRHSLDRYKIVVLVTYGPQKRQGIDIGLRGLWDSERDSYVKHSYENSYIFCSAIIFAVYYN